MANDMLVRMVQWPEGLTIAHINARLDGVRRFVDFDGTIVDDGRLRSDIGGVPMNQFLNEEPYVIQTWNPTDARRWAASSADPDIHRPRLIIFVPGALIHADGSVEHLAMPTWPRRYRPGSNEHPPAHVMHPGLYKDFEVLGLTGITIYDDDPRIHAPECTVVRPW